ncbi:uncharacterized protein LOC111715036 [Eurytemora carolleeae]|uniref:uncharacterized protein LOC111715036 n=1 Tax=Eurytemora carolleeae TaxID=1294199 RepID=UPI000C760A7C|nr:uncharacterized protein LOC111715036 [Eurytemora carolleeae]|eukprot:XP_023346042.1 uncharacterized protein LOC111715036 [Eurytemora affinis]
MDASQTHANLASTAIHIWTVAAVYNIISIYCYLRLFLFLKNNTEANSALRAQDRARDRQRNILPARIGIIHLILFFSPSTFLYILFYSNGTNQTLGVKQFSLAMSSDIIQCLISPAVFFYGSEEMRKIILAPILWMQIQLTDLVYPNRVHNIAPQVCRSREGVRGTP